MDRIDKLMQDDDIFSLVGYEHRELMERNSIRRQGFKDGMEQGIQQGIERNTIAMIKSFYENNADLDLIAKSTDKTIEEIILNI